MNEDHTLGASYGVVDYDHGPMGTSHVITFNQSVIDCAYVATPVSDNSAVFANVLQGGGIEGQSQVIVHLYGDEGAQELAGVNVVVVC